MTNPGRLQSPVRVGQLSRVNHMHCAPARLRVVIRAGTRFQDPRPLVAARSRAALRVTAVPRLLRIPNNVGRGRCYIMNMSSWSTRNERQTGAVLPLSATRR